MKLLSKILPHIAIVISVMLITFYWIDRFNSAMNFINNDMTKMLMFILGVVALINGITIIAYQRKEKRRQIREYEEKKRQ